MYKSYSTLDLSLTKIHAKILKNTEFACVLFSIKHIPNTTIIFSQIHYY